MTAGRGARQKACGRALRRGATRAVGSNKAKNNNRPRPALQRPSPADLALLHRSLSPSPASLLPATSVYERRSRSSFSVRPIPPRHPSSSVFNCLLVIPSSSPARDGVPVPVLPWLPSRAVHQHSLRQRRLGPNVPVSPAHTLRRQRRLPRQRLLHRARPRQASWLWPWRPQGPGCRRCPRGSQDAKPDPERGKGARKEQRL